MPIPAAIAKANRRVTNPVLGRLAGRVPPFAMVEHRGRKSGRTYRTPVFAFERDGVVTIALTYGSGVDWLANARAAGGCGLTFRRRRLRLGAPRELDTAAGMDRMPGLIQLGLTAMAVREFVEFPVLP